MHTLYITDNGMMLKKRSNRIAVKKGGKIIEEIPILDLKRILIFGNNQISSELLRLLARKGIEVAFLSMNNRFNYRIVPDTSKNIYLRMAQHHQYNDMGFRVKWSKKIIGAKLKNQKNALMRFRKNKPDVDLSEEIGQMDKSIKNLRDKTGIDDIMGVEGYGSRIYYRGFGKIIIGDFVFTKRDYYPPPDPVNALLSFGYMMLFNELKSLLEAFGFDPYLGFLHSAKYGRASLATDLMEEFRSPLIDRLVLYLINLGVVKPSDFEEKERGVRMNDRARKAYLQNYEKFMTTSFVNYGTRKSTNFRQILRGNVVQLEKCLLKNEIFSSFVFYA